MATIKQFRQKLRAINNEELLVSLVFEQLKKYEGVLVDYVQLQLEEGQNPKGKLIGTYSRATELEALFGKVKPLLPKKEGEPFNFQWTGGYFDGMFLKVTKKEAVFGSNDQKASLLESQYGELLGLQVKNFIKAKEDSLLPGFLKKLRKRLDL